MKNKILLITCILLLIPLASAVQVGYESAAVARIVGESPEEMSGQLQQNNINLREATYYYSTGSSMHRDVTSREVNSILEDSFNDNVEYTDDLGFWDWDIVSEEINAWRSNNLLIVEGRGEIDDNEIEILSPMSESLSPAEIDWSNFEVYHPLVFFNMDFAGLYLPNMRTLVGKVTKDAAIISTTSKPDDQFLKTFICNLGREDGREDYSGGTYSLGKTYRNARNNYYWQIQRPSGLALMSYQLYGNPLAAIEIPNNNPSSSYCDDVVEDYDLLESESFYKIYKSEEYSSTEEVLDLYTYEATEVISDYDLTENGNHTLITIPGYIQSTDEEYPMLPKKVAQFEVPLGTVVTNIEILSRSNPVNINLGDVPSWEHVFVDRLCKENSYPATVKSSHSFTNDYEVVLLEINPVEVIDCEAGEFRLYQEMQYKVDYLPDSPVLFHSVTFPDRVLPGEITGIEIDFSRVKTEPVYGQVRLLLNEEVIAEKVINAETDSFTRLLSFTAPEEEGLFNFQLEFVEDGRVKSRTNFNLRVSLLDAFLITPERVWETANVELDLYNHGDEPLEVILVYENEELDFTETRTLTLNHGWNVNNVVFTGLRRETQSYPFSVNVYYGDFRKVLSGLLVTNRAPVITNLVDITVKEGQTVTLEPIVSDPEYDSVTMTISEPLSDGVWISSYSDAGEHPITVTASDGYLETEKEIVITVEDVPEDDTKVVFRDCNYGLYRGGLSEIAIYDYETESLQSYFMNTQYDEVKNHFAFKTFEDWVVGTCEGNEFICLDDSNTAELPWGEGDDFPDPVFERGGECETNPEPLFKYEEHEVCQGNIECFYPVCEVNNDCGDDRFVGEKYCIDDAVYLDKRVHTCSDASTYDASCNFADVPELLETCAEGSACNSGACYNVMCYSDDDCGTPADEGNQCTDSGVYNTYREFNCLNPGTADSSCEAVDTETFVETCDENDFCVYGECLPRSVFLQGQFDDGSESQMITFYESGTGEYYIIMPKDVEVTSTSITVRGGEE